MTDPVILKDCDGCGDRTAHTREQRAKIDPPRIVTEYACSQCGNTHTHTEIFSFNERLPDRPPFREGASK